LVMIRYGRNFSGTGQNLATGFIALKHWDERPGEENTAQAIRERAMQHFREFRDAQDNANMPASVRDLAQTICMECWSRDSEGNGRKFLHQQFKQLETAAPQYTTFENLCKRSNPEKAELKVNIDQKQAMANGLNQTAINSTLSAAWGGNYVNDFIDRGRIKRVMMQGDAKFRSKPEDLAMWHVRNDQNQMVPFSNFSTVNWSGGPEVVNRFMGYTALQLEADISKGASTGEAMNDVEQLVANQDGIDGVWSGLSFEEKQ